MKIFVYFPMFGADVIWSREKGLAVPSRVSTIVSRGWVSISFASTPMGQFRAHQVTQLHADGA